MSVKIATIDQSAAIPSMQAQTRTQANIRVSSHQPNRRIMSVVEHQRLGAQDFLVTSDFEWLMTQELPVFGVKRAYGQWQLKVGHYIGIIVMPSGITLEILPKALNTDVNNHHADVDNKEAQQQSRRWVQRMLSDIINSEGKSPHQRHFGQFGRDIVPMGRAAPPLSEWLIQQFLQHLSHYQPSKHYQTQVRNEAALQGKLLIKTQLQKNAHQPHKLACEVSMLSQETVANGLIKSALMLLEPLIQVSSDAALRRMLVAWQPIRPLSAYERAQLPSIYAQARHELSCQPLPASQQQAAHHVLELAYWLLQSQHSVAIGSVYHAAPTASASSLRLCMLINMNQAFEQWASGQIAASFNNATSHYQTVLQPRDVWLQDSTGQTCLSVQPDLLVYQYKDDTNQQATCSHVIDIKWKHLPHAAAISASDAYQLLSYAQAYAADQVWLVYPVTSHACKPMPLRPPKSDTGQATLWLVPFNVTTGQLNITDVSTLASQSQLSML